MGAPDYTVGHYDREGSMILDEFHNFLANLDVFTNIAMKHMPGAHFFGLCIFGGYNTDSGLRRLAEVRTIERNRRKRPSPHPLLGFLAQTLKKFIVSHRTLVPTAAPSPGGTSPRSVERPPVSTPIRGTAYEDSRASCNVAQIRRFVNSTIGDGQ